MTERRPVRGRWLWISALVAVVLAGTGYVWWTAAAAGPGGGATARGTSGELRFVDLEGGGSAVDLVPLADPSGPRTSTGEQCLRVYAAAGVTVCLRIAGPGPTYEAAVVDDRVDPTHVVPLPGVPSRARVSASGRIVSWTSFVTGDSYSVPGGFSTRSGILDTTSGEVVESIEDFDVEVDGSPLTTPDLNVWGVTVAADDRTFYATVASGGRTWLAAGDLATRTLRAVRRDAECPSLSPDGTRIAYKKRIGRFGPWDLAVLDLATGRERRLPGTAGVDDQAEWLDDTTLVYAGVPSGARLPAIHTVAADGARPAQVILPDATSPSVVR